MNNNSGANFGPPGPYGCLTNFGWLYAHGLMRQPKVWYCPRETTINMTFNARHGSDNSLQNQWPPARYREPAGFIGFPPTSYTAWTNQYTRVGYYGRPVKSWHRTISATWMSDLHPDGGLPKLAKQKKKAILAERPSVSGIRNRHQTGMNVIYADGSGRFVTILPNSQYKQLLDQYTATNLSTYVIDTSTNPNGGMWGALDRE